jgi:DNA invertase Pin-like site-specific DNA recombinase
MKAFCDYNGYEIAGEYEDAGRSGKSIEGRDHLQEQIQRFSDSDFTFSGSYLIDRLF